MKSGEGFWLPLEKIMSGKRDYVTPLGSGFRDSMERPSLGEGRGELKEASEEEKLTTETCVVCKRR